MLTTPEARPSRRSLRHRTPVEATQVGDDGSRGAAVLPGQDVARAPAAVRAREDTARGHTPLGASPWGASTTWGGPNRRGGPSPAAGTSSVVPPTREATPDRQLRRRRALRRGRVLLWRWRHLVAALAAALAGLILVEEISPKPPPSDPVVVLRTAKPAGSLLGRTDLVVRQVPTGILPEGAWTDPADVVGARLAVGLPSGYPIVDGVLARPGLVAAAPSGTVVVPLRLADPDVAELLDAGDYIDIVRTPSDGGEARVVAQRVLVMARTEPDSRGAFELGSPSPPLILVAAPPRVATLLVGAGAVDPISAVLVRGDA